MNKKRKYIDLKKSDLTRDDSSSSSSYCEVIDDSDAEYDKDFSCVNLNIDLNGKNINKKFASSKLLVNQKHKFVRNQSNDIVQRTQTNGLANLNGVDFIFKQPKINRNQPVNSQLNNSNQKLMYTSVFEPRTDTNINSFYEYPWVNRNNLEYKPGVLGLHDEIQDFYEYSKLKPEEIRVRNLVFCKLKEVIKHRWSGAKVYLFGSFQTNLSLPFADLDIVIFNYETKIPFVYLESKLIKDGLTTSDDVKIIDKANVPIIKFIHTHSGINVDLSFNCGDGPKAIKLIQSFIKKYPALPKLLLIIKLYLHQRELNFSYTGGLSSYSITLMMIAFFKQHSRQEELISDKENLGILLLEFLEFFGFKFNHNLLGISIKRNNCFVEKYLLPCLSRQEAKQSRLCIEDPMDPANNPSKNSFLYDKIKKSFQYAFIQLHMNCRLQSLNKTNQCPNLKSILSQMVGYKRDQLKIREKVLEFHHNKFECIRPKTNKDNTCALDGDFIALSKSIPDEIQDYDDYQFIEFSK